MTNSVVLVTGGAGFIGSHLVDALLANGDHVRVLDNLSTGSRRNIAGASSNVELIEGDIRDAAVCAAACLGVRVVYHLAALGSVPRSMHDPLTTDAVNTRGTLNLLIAARDAGVARVVFSSSSSVYGDTEVLPKVESMRAAPRSPYAVSKLAGEEYCRAFYHAFQLETVVLRYFNVFGPRQSAASEYAAVIPRFVSALLDGKPPTLYGDGLQSRDFTYVGNVVKANLLAGRAASAAGAVCNVACGEQVTVLQVLSEIAARLGVEPAPVFMPARPGDVRHSRADITIAQSLLGYEPETLFSAGMDRTMQSYLMQSPNAAP